MTAVAPPPVQPLPRWEAGKDVGESYELMSAEEVTRSLMPRKSTQRPIPSAPSNTTPSTSVGTNTAPAPPQTNDDSTLLNADRGGWGPRKKAAKFWPSKAEPLSGLSTARGQSMPPSSGQSAASTMNPQSQQPSPGLLMQQVHAQQNGGRQEQAQPRVESTAILALQPLTGTFERKQIIVPFFPDVQKIGRQTNQKTIPAANNGYFDSKVLSRSHAEIWADRNGRIWIRDVKSSNGTFVNGQRLSQENKDSDPHELRESDTLELGIDIVSEDQKSIVHHKVSAKVELAGLYGNGPTLLDMMHIDPGNGHPMLNDHTSQQLAQMRGRGGSQGSNGSRASIPQGVAVSANLLGAYRQMNMWLNPITIEQVVKKLAMELKQAKQQSHDLHCTSDFFTSLLKLEPGEEPPKSPPKRHSASAQTQPLPNGPSPAPPSDMLLPFSQPPAPPPSQPLPEKPDSARLAMTDSLVQPGLKRTGTERPSSQHSPTRPEPQNGQIMSLVEALKVAKQEINSQGDRMKYLENALKRERKARELAERRAQALSRDRSTSGPQENGLIDEEAFDPPLDSLDLMEQDLPNGQLEAGEDRDMQQLTSSPSMETLRDAEDVHPNTDGNDSSASNLEDRYELLKQEFDQMKVYMEQYKRRAEEAEGSQQKFAEMVENIRAGRNTGAPAPAIDSNDTTLVGNDDADDAVFFKDLTLQQDRLNHGLWSSSKQKSLPNGTAHVTSKHQQEWEKTKAQALQQQGAHPNGGGQFVQSAPYVSMVGVVLIGIGLMHWLNGWQPTGGGKVLE